VPFLLCGLVVWKWFAGSVSLGANAIQMHMGLIRQVYVRKAIFPAAAMLTNAVRFGFVFIIYTAFLPLFGIAPGVAWIALIPIILTQFLLNAACGFLAASVVPFIPDIKPLIEKLLMLGFFMSGIFFNIAQVPESIRGYFFLNPMAVLIDGYRNAMLNGVWPAWMPLCVIAAISIVVLLLATAIMSRYERAYPKAMA
jgi:lipopolysaccharide transport system permease protein